MKKLVPFILSAIGFAMVLWVSFSTVEVACKNHETNPQYSAINLWAMIANDTEEEVQTSQYIGYGRYYTNGTVITNDGNEWSYTTDTISDKTPTDAMPVWVAFDDNGTPDNIKDDIILGLVYDRNTAIYDDLETALSDKFDLERDGNNIHIKEVR